MELINEKSEIIMLSLEVVSCNKMTSKFLFFRDLSTIHFSFTCSYFPFSNYDLASQKGSFIEK